MHKMSLERDYFCCSAAQILRRVHRKIMTQPEIMLLQCLQMCAVYLMLCTPNCIYCIFIFISLIYPFLTRASEDTHDKKLIVDLILNSKIRRFSAQLKSKCKLYVSDFSASIRIRATRRDACNYLFCPMV